jgi:hypothetical protein
MQVFALASFGIVQQGHLRQGQKRSHFALKRIQSSVKLEKVIQRNS